jgi:hypothetical protein
MVVMVVVAETDMSRLVVFQLLHSQAQLKLSLIHLVHIHLSLERSLVTLKYLMLKYGVPVEAGVAYQVLQEKIVLVAADLDHTADLKTSHDLLDQLRLLLVQGAHLVESVIILSVVEMEDFHDLVH